MNNTIPDLLRELKQKQMELEQYMINHSVPYEYIVESRNKFNKKYEHLHSTETTGE
jgi:hypothetical protein